VNARHVKDALLGLAVLFSLAAWVFVMVMAFR
jgi:hypothetical protein